MSIYIKTAAQRHWAVAIFGHHGLVAPMLAPGEHAPGVTRASDGPQAARACRLQWAIKRAHFSVSPFRRSMRWFDRLEDEGVIQRLTLDADGLCLPLEFDDVPLFGAGPNWKTFVAEALRLPEMS